MIFLAADSRCSPASVRRRYGGDSSTDRRTLCRGTVARKCASPVQHFTHGSGSRLFCLETSCNELDARYRNLMMCAVRFSSICKRICSGFSAWIASMASAATIRRSTGLASRAWNARASPLRRESPSSPRPVRTAFLCQGQAVHRPGSHCW